MDEEEGVACLLPREFDALASAVWYDGYILVPLCRELQGPFGQSGEQTTIVAWAEFGHALGRVRCRK